MTYHVSVADRDGQPFTATEAESEDPGIRNKNVPKRAANSPYFDARRAVIGVIRPQGPLHGLTHF
ncbi:MAG: hypothetical protein AVDCRST_MAG02-1494 [uncultured Rubrobacteraceae bacterium]|uniref:Uncharacterized protein n=1 Tax=uncultured Rubrobacteraceae bacterium TaxID=349277 RepID=A0A6J4QZ33_9ACTN|nr:MAG: hypothetical protein AVDCRST_MAG02-1494 [uncultured Rubrobacteraceae bacterium]